MANETYDFGMIGLGTMGRNLLLNMADHGFKVAGYDRDAQKISILEENANKGTIAKGFTELADMINSLSKPRKLMMLVPAGNPVDDVIKGLLPLLDNGDIVIDGGNSHYTDTLRRVNALKEKDIHFMGIGISGGEQGARNGPSIMPGGDAEAYAVVQPILEAVAAKVNKTPCVAYLGKHAAGHYVKMVHNGIEYAIMQLISECYDLMHRGLGLSNDELSDVFAKWNKEDLKAYLIEITADIFKYEDDKTTNRLVDMIVDKAGAKGTGKWTSQDAIDLPVPVPTIDMAVTVRNISSFKDQRKEAAELYKTAVKKIRKDKDAFIQQLHDALYFGTLISYSQGMSMLEVASTELDMNIPLNEVVKVWRGGCIIRSSLLDVFVKAFEQHAVLPNLLLDNGIAELLLAKEQNMREVIVTAINAGFPCGALMTALTYFDAYRSAELPTNLIQAQRDYFGAHTYQRVDEPGTFHTEWIKVKL
ncbi:MAG: NADP-dependent phosphogluconate dehydrogenase [Williamsia sp.]|nr:NADP-dependent phosphogluconate dehydrogenase [Williamsia sp.]